MQTFKCHTLPTTNCMSIQSGEILKASHASKLREPRQHTASWEWWRLHLRAVLKEWYVSICLKTAPSQMMTLKMLTQYSALTLLLSEARRLPRRRHKRVITDYVNISRLLVDVNQRVTLAADVMFVNLVPFLVSVS